MAKSDNLTVDIKPSWLKPIRAAQAACTKNRGYGIVYLAVLVNKNDPVMWKEPVLVKIHPARMAESNISPMILSALLDNIDDENTRG